MVLIMCVKFPSIHEVTFWLFGFYFNLLSLKTLQHYQVSELCNLAGSKKKCPSKVPSCVKTKHYDNLTQTNSTGGLLRCASEILVHGGVPLLLLINVDILKWVLTWYIMYHVIFNSSCCCFVAVAGFSFKHQLKSIVLKGGPVHKSWKLS